MKPIFFEVEDSYQVAGGAIAFAGKCPVDCSTEDGSELLGRFAILSGATWGLALISGVETFLLPRPLKVGDKIALLVKLVGAEAEAHGS